MKKTFLIGVSLLTMIAASGCGSKVKTSKDNKTEVLQLMNYDEALKIFPEETKASVLDIETGITFEVKRVTGGFNTLADIETITKEDTDKLLKSAGGDWNIRRRAVIVTIGDKKIPASISPFQHSGDEEKPFGEIVDNRSGATGTGINLDSIRDNGMTGVVDLYFYNSLTPGVNRVDERHQEMVLKAAEYEN